MPRQTLAILILAAALRIAWGVSVPVSPVSDSNAYDTLAQTLATHHVYGWNAATPTAFWPVGTSWVYSVFYRFAGHSYAPIVVFNVLLGVGIVALGMALASRWQGTNVGLATGILLALWPGLIEFTTVLASELPFIFLTFAAVLIWMRPGWARSIFVGLLLAAAAYIRPLVLLLPVILALLAWGQGRQPRLIATHTILIYIVIIACILPWSVRNACVLGRFAWISTNGGVNTWMGNNPASTGLYMDMPPFTAHLSEAERDRVLGHQAGQYIRQHPGLFLRRTLLKIFRTHERESIGIVWNQPGLSHRFPPILIPTLKLLGNLYWWIMLLLAAGGLFQLLRQLDFRVWLLQPPVLLWAYFAAVHAVTVAQDRYHYPSIPFIAMLAAFFLTLLPACRIRIPWNSPRFFTTRLRSMTFC